MVSGNSKNGLAGDLEEETPVGFIISLINTFIGIFFRYKDFCDGFLERDWKKYVKPIHFFTASLGFSLLMSSIFSDIQPVEHGSKIENILSGYIPLLGVIVFIIPYAYFKNLFMGNRSTLRNTVYLNCYTSGMLFYLASIVPVIGDQPSNFMSVVIGAIYIWLVVRSLQMQKYIYKTITLRVFLVNFFASIPGAISTLILLLVLGGVSDAVAGPENLE